MEPMNLNFDFRDLFKSPRLALSGKKICIFIYANLLSYLIYFILNYIDLCPNGIIELVTAIEVPLFELNIDAEMKPKVHLHQQFERTVWSIVHNNKQFFHIELFLYQYQLL